MVMFSQQIYRVDCDLEEKCDDPGLFFFNPHQWCNGPVPQITMLIIALIFG